MLTGCTDLDAGVTALVVGAGALVAGGVAGIVGTARGPAQLRVVVAPPDLGALAGLWSGTVRQPGGRPDAYRVTVNLGSACGDGTVGVSSYPDLGCAGELHAVSAAAGHLIAVERLTRGARRCNDDVRVELALDGDVLTYTATPAGRRSPAATATLRRGVPGPSTPTTPTTATCPLAINMLTAFEEAHPGQADRITEEGCSDHYVRVTFQGPGLPDGVNAFFRRTDEYHVVLLSSGTASDACAAKGSPSAAYASAVIPRADAEIIGCSLE